jgi:hypothetical protein
MMQRKDKGSMEGGDDDKDDDGDENATRCNDGNIGNNRRE